MRVYWAFLLVCATSVLGAPKSNDRIVGGSLAVISQYPFIASLLYSSNLVSYYQACGGIILSKTAILTAAHCVSGDPVARWRVRVGSTNSNSGGYTYTFRQFIVHAGYQSSKLDNDIAVLKTEMSIIFKNDAVGQATIAGGSYSLPDNEPVWAVGWGATTSGGIGSEQLRHVQIWTVNQATCRARYAELGHTVTENMLCSGMLDVGGRDQCQGDSGGPLIHNNVIVGIYSWGHQCGLARYPGVNTRVSRFALWIQMATVQETNFETV